MKKILIKGVIYTAVFLLLNLTEQVMGVRGFSLGLLFALAFCKENLLLLLPIYLGTAMVITPELMYLASVGTAAGVVLFCSIFHYRWKKRMTMLEMCLLVLLAQTPAFVLNTGDVYYLISTVVGAFLSIAVLYVGILFFYPVLIRGLRYKLSAKETLSGGVLLICLSIGLYSVQFFEFYLFYLLLSFCLIFFRGLERDTLILFGLCIGLGGSISAGVMLPLGLSAILAIVVAVTVDINRFIIAAAAPFAYLVGAYYFNDGITLMGMLPVLLGAVAAVCFPNQLFLTMRKMRQGQQEKFALRTVVNRDREEVARSLKSIGKAFSDMQSILVKEEGEKECADKRIAEELSYSLCGNCPKYDGCVVAMGNPCDAIGRLVMSAMDHGKATILDASVGLGENCAKLPRLIQLTNETVKEYKRNVEFRSGVELGREMVTVQMGGISKLFSELAESVKKGLSFDTELERALIEELSYSNIIASDVIIHGEDGKIEEVTLLTREEDVAKKQLSEIISSVMGLYMTETGREREVKGMTALHFAPAPRFSVLYGESVVSKENRCGDTREAVQIGRNKLMFVLSDGMGTGARAYDTANNIILLIESFYRAGFDHRTVMTSVGRLLSLRKMEDFSALDLVIVDIMTGDADFIKQGGRESYIFSKDSFERIEGGALPLGILEDVQPVFERRRLRPDEFLVMMSDGVADVLDADRMRELTAGGLGCNPQVIADMVTRNAVELGRRSGISDDRTAIVLRLIPESR